MRWKSFSLRRSRAHPQQFSSSGHRPGETSHRHRSGASLRNFAPRHDVGHPLAVVANLGSTLCVQDVNRPYLNMFTLVEPHDSQAAGPLLSVVSPLGRALLGARAGDLVEIAGRKGRRRLLVKAILSPRM